jgi:hypothetical protein
MVFGDAVVRSEPVEGIGLRPANGQNLVRTMRFPKSQAGLRAGWVLLCSLVLWSSTPASAHFLNHHDPDDAAGRLDLSDVHLWEYQQEGLFSLVVNTYDQIEGQHGRFIGWFDSFGDSRWDYALIMRVPSGCRMIARIGGPHTSLWASRVDPTRAHCLFQLLSGFRRTKHIRLRVWAKGEHGIVDRAPDAGWFHH